MKCAECNHEMERRRSTKQFCSAACRARARRKRYARTEFTCEVCKAPFTREAGKRGRAPLYCSKQCRRQVAAVLRKLRSGGVAVEEIDQTAFFLFKVVQDACSREASMVLEALLIWRLSSHFGEMFDLFKRLGTCCGASAAGITGTFVGAVEVACGEEAREHFVLLVDAELAGATSFQDKKDAGKRLNSALLELMDELKDKLDLESLEGETLPPVELPERIREAVRWSAGMLRHPELKKVGELWERAVRSLSLKVSDVERDKIEREVKAFLNGLPPEELELIRRYNPKPVETAKTAPNESQLARWLTKLGDEQWPRASIG